MGQVRGKSISLNIGQQADFPTRTPADGYKNTFMYSIRPGGGQAFETDAILGGQFNNNRDATAPAPGLSDSNVSLSVPACMNHLGFWLEALLGAPVLSGSGPFVRTFTSGKDTLPFHTLAYGYGASDGRRLTGFAAGSMAFNIARNAGFGQLAIEGAARKFEPLADIDVGTVPAALDLARAPAYRGVFRVDSTIEASLVSSQMTYNNNLDLVPFATDDEFIGDICPGDSTFGGNITLRYKDRTYADLAADAFNNSGLFAGEWEWQNGAGDKLLLSAPKCRIAPTTEEISSPGGIEVSYSVVAEQTTAAPMLTAVLTNGLASGSYL